MGPDRSAGRSLDGGHSRSFVCDSRPHLALGLVSGPSRFCCATEYQFAAALPVAAVGRWPKAKPEGQSIHRGRRKLSESFRFLTLGLRPRNARARRPTLLVDNPLSPQTDPQPFSGPWRARFTADWSYRFLYTCRVKTTLDIDNELLVKAKALAARERTSLTALIEEGLRLRLRKRSEMTPRQTSRIAVYRGTGGLVAGVDPLSNRALLDAADDDA